MYGISFTHGIPRNHIWTLAAGQSEIGASLGAGVCIHCDCPCAHPANPERATPPPFVGDNYYCESGNPMNTVVGNHLYGEDALWDGQHCEGQCCRGGKFPPWFTVTLPNTTTDDIEVRLCIPAVGNIDQVEIQLLELYIN